MVSDFPTALNSVEKAWIPERAEWSGLHTIYMKAVFLIQNKTEQTNLFGFLS